MGDYDDVKVSVIVRCRNEERYIGHCLQSLDDYLTTPEVILLNDNSTDNSMRIANTFDWMNIKKININNDEYLPGKKVLIQ
jgi:glycosyltransferase involved in cell wall biosynthesis